MKNVYGWILSRHWAEYGPTISHWLGLRPKPNKRIFIMDNVFIKIITPMMMMIMIIMIIVWNILHRFTIYMNGTPNI